MGHNFMSNWVVPLMRRPAWLLLLCCLATNASQARDIFVNNVSGSDRFDHQRQLWIQTCFERWDDADGAGC